MALEYHTGFDLIPTTTPGTYLAQLGWTHIDNAAISTSVFRNGTRALGSISTSSVGVGVGNLTNAATRVLGFGLYLNNFPTSGVWVVAVVGDGGLVSANAQIGLAVTSTGLVQMFRGRGASASTGGTLLATSSNALVAATWQFLELVVTVHASTGTVELFVNGSKTGWIDLAGANTQQTANAYSNIIGFGGATGAQTFVDDVYTLTTTGAAPTSRLGDCKTVTKFAGTDAALGIGTYTDSTPLSGTDQGAMVDDAPTPDDDSTYNAFTAAAQKDSYKTAALGLTGTIHAATVRARLKKSDAGAGSAQVGLRSGAIDDFSADVFPSDASYAWFSRQYPTDPNTGAAWTVANLDAAQLLVKRTL